MLSKLNLANWGLIIGAIGQGLFYSNLFPHVPYWTFLLLAFPPWLTVYVISFFRKPPFGPRLFRRCLLFAMYWYTAVTAVAEIANLIFPPASNKHVSIAVVRVITYGGALSFIVFIRVCIMLRNYERDDVVRETQRG